MPARPRRRAPSTNPAHGLQLLTSHTSSPRIVHMHAAGSVRPTFAHRIARAARMRGRGHGCARARWPCGPAARGCNAEGCPGGVRAKGPSALCRFQGERAQAGARGPGGPLRGRRACQASSSGLAGRAAPCMALRHTPSRAAQRSRPLRGPACRVRERLAGLLPPPQLLTALVLRACMGLPLRMGMGPVRASDLSASAGPPCANNFVQVVAPGGIARGSMQGERRSRATGWAPPTPADPITALVLRACMRLPLRMSMGPVLHVRPISPRARGRPARIILCRLLRPEAKSHLARGLNAPTGSASEVQRLGFCFLRFRPPVSYHCFVPCFTSLSQPEPPAACRCFIALFHTRVLAVPCS
jgi:hypothetical protein